MEVGVSLVSSVVVGSSCWASIARSQPALGRHADLRRHAAIRRKGHDPPEVHDDLHPKRITVERLRGIELVCCNVRNDAPYGRRLPPYSPRGRLPNVRS